MGLIVSDFLSVVSYSLALGLNKAEFNGRGTKEEGSHLMVARKQGGGL